MEFKDYYKILGVEAGAGEAEVKAAYRRLARKYHPDVSKEAGAEDKFKAVNEAYEVLRDTQKRAAYDQLRTQGYKPGEEFRPPPDFGNWQQNHGGREFRFDFGDDAAGGRGGFSDFFESLFGGRGRARGAGADFAQAGAGADAALGSAQALRAKLLVPLETVFAGGSHRIQVDDRVLDVKIPAGVKPGQVIRLAGQGAKGRRGAGDLLLEIDYAPHPQFEVDGANILYVLPLAPWEAALGAKVSVPTLGGAVELKIPANSDTGRKLRLKGRGLPDKPGAGDQLVEIEIHTPKADTDAQRELYRKMAKTFAFDPRAA
ncbi:MAG: DnaJ domain-containing protein [Proteobacteria bacterium]|nr:DnaJ domain-containing protein [Pseudomonadota bacterium]MBS0464408.1 DnaJ domain-containing protein [Pseudomonadota bacterium]